MMRESRRGSLRESVSASNRCEPRGAGVGDPTGFGLPGRPKSCLGFLGGPQPPGNGVAPARPPTDPARHPSGATHHGDPLEMVPVAPQLARGSPRKCKVSPLWPPILRPPTAHGSAIKAQEPVIVHQPVGHELAGKGPRSRWLRCNEVPDDLVSRLAPPLVERFDLPAAKL